MKTKIFIVFLSCMINPLFCQIGINTPTPTAMLDINGNLKVRDVPAVTSLPGHMLMAVDLASSEVVKIDPDAALANAFAYSAKKVGSISLLDLGLAPAPTWKLINFLAADKTTGDSSLFTESDYSYIVPSTGVYSVGFYFRYGSGLQASLLTGGPGIGVLKKTNNTVTALDTRLFSGLNLGLAAITISESSINSLYRLEAGDKLYFGLTNGGVLTTSLLSSSNASFFVHKVSN
jgi:hypothetical protein